MNVSRIFWDDSVTHQNDTDYSKSLLGAELTVAIFGTFVNIAFMGYILSSHSLRVSNSSAFAISLSLADCLVCSVVMVVNSLNHKGLLRGITTMELCGTWSAFAVFACSASSFNVTAMAVDRYICIGDPLNYYSHMPRKLLYITLSTIWLSCLLLAFIPLASGQLLSTPFHLKGNHCVVNPGSTYVILITTITIILPCAIIICIYTRIFVMAYRRSNFFRKSIMTSKAQLESTGVSGTSTATKGSSGTSSEQQPEADDDLHFDEPKSFNDFKPSDDFDPFQAKIAYHTHRLSSLRNLFFTRLFSSHAKATILLSFIVLVFIIHWLPFGIVKIVSVARPKLISARSLRVCLWLLLLHSCWNPFVFLLCNSSVRASLHRCRCHQRSRQTSSVIHDNNATTSIMFPNLVD